MNIRPSAAIRQNYNEIAELCRGTHAPVYLTKNGEGDLVVMDIESFARREKMLGITPFATDTLDDRKLRLLSRYNENIPYTRKSLAALLESLCGAGGYILTITTATFTVNVKVALGVKKQETIISETLERILPYNMVFTVELLYNTWAKVKPYKWSEVKPLTWKDLKEEVLA